MKQKTQAQILNLSFFGINISVRLKNLAGNLFILYLLDCFCRE